MSISKNLDVNNFLEYMHKIFAKRGKDFSKSFGSVILSMMHCCSASSWSIASSLSSLFDKGFKASLKQVSYLLSNDNFEVDDQLWRCYLKSIFAILNESSYIKKTEKIYIQVDYTTIKNDFLILYASIVFNGKSLPIYFTKRAYPKKKNQMSMTKMERAFLKGLRHILSVKYNYVIVADRGFGTNNFTQECINNGCCCDCWIDCTDDSDCCCHFVDRVDDSGAGNLNFGRGWGIEMGVSYFYFVFYCLVRR